MLLGDDDRMTFERTVLRTTRLVRSSVRPTGSAHRDDTERAEDVASTESTAGRGDVLHHTLDAG
jgi:hypothetical protein